MAEDDGVMLLNLTAGDSSGIPKRRTMSNITKNMVWAEKQKKLAQRKRGRTGGMERKARMETTEGTNRGSLVAEKTVHSTVQPQLRQSPKSVAGFQESVGNESRVEKEGSSPQPAGEEQESSTSFGVTSRPNFRAAPVSDGVPKSASGIQSAQKVPLWRQIQREATRDRSTPIWRQIRRESVEKRQQQTTPDVDNKLSRVEDVEVQNVDEIDDDALNIQGAKEDKGVVGEQKEKPADDNGSDNSSDDSSADSSDGSKDDSSNESSDESSDCSSSDDEVESLREDPSSNTSPAKHVEKQLETAQADESDESDESDDTNEVSSSDGDEGEASAGADLARTAPKRPAAEKESEKTVESSDSEESTSQSESEPEEEDAEQVHSTEEGEEGEAGKSAALPAEKEDKSDSAEDTSGSESEAGESGDDEEVESESSSNSEDDENDGRKTDGTSEIKVSSNHNSDSSETDDAEKSRGEAGRGDSEESEDSIDSSSEGSPMEEDQETVHGRGDLETSFDGTIDMDAQAGSDEEDDNSQENKEGDDPSENEMGHANQLSAEVLSDPSLFDESSFDDLNLSPTLTRHVKLRMKLENPTKVQSMTVKALSLQTEKFPDVMIRSQTGSGKTLAFLLPIAHSLLERRKKVERSDGALAIILEPTRELAAQVELVAQELFRPWHWVVVSAIMGGEKKKSEKARLRKGVTVLITTPGRMVDHLRSTKSLQLANCEWLVLDEADRLLDLGFGPHIKEIIETIEQRSQNVRQAELERTGRNLFRKRRQTMLLSATLTKEVDALANLSLQEPEKVIFGDGKQVYQTPEKLRQHFCVVDQRLRLITLISILRLRAKANPSMKAIVFLSTCDAVNFYYQLFQSVPYPSDLDMSPNAGRHEEEEEDSDADEKPGSKKKQKILPNSLCWVPVYKLHGSMDQVDRINTFKEFSKASGGILLSTDVSARGLDLSRLGLSIQFDPPTHDEDIEYVHRAGRTARMGTAGDALLFVLPEERSFIEHLEKDKGFEMKEIEADSAVAALRGKRVKDTDKASKLVTAVLQRALQGAVEKNEELKILSSMGYRSYIRAYTTHSSSVKKYFHPKNLHLGHVARSFALKGEPMTRMEIHKAQAAMVRANFARKSSTNSDQRTGDNYRSAEKYQTPRGSQGPLKKRRRTTLRPADARSLLSSEFGA